MNIMSSLTYQKMLFENDADVPRLAEIYQEPEIARYLSISDNYFHYVTNNENVHFYKVYKNGEMIGTTHLEQQGIVLFMDVLVFPKFQRVGLGTQIIRDIQDDIFNLVMKTLKFPLMKQTLHLYDCSGMQALYSHQKKMNC